MPLLVVEGPENSGKDRMIHQVLQRWSGDSAIFHHFEGDNIHRSYHGGYAVCR